MSKGEERPLIHYGASVNGSKLWDKKAAIKEETRKLKVWQNKFGFKRQPWWLK